jgi:hypothetical protein
VDGQPSNLVTAAPTVTKEISWRKVYDIRPSIVKANLWSLAVVWVPTVKMLYDEAIDKHDRRTSSSCFWASPLVSEEMEVKLKAMAIALTSRCPNPRRGC